MNKLQFIASLFIVIKMYLNYKQTKKLEIKEQHFII